MPTKKKKKDNVKKDRVITYDKSGIKIIDKFFDVNQELPSAEMLGEIIKYRYIQKNIDTQINNYTGIIEQIDKQQTEILKNFTNTSISEFNELEKQKENLQEISFFKVLENFPHYYRKISLLMIGLTVQ